MLSVQFSQNVLCGLIPGLARPIKWALARAGYGHDAFLDIERLSQAWQYSLDVFLDVGGNDGATIRRARDRFKNCRITAFEPHPKTFLCLTENMREVRNVLNIGRDIPTTSGCSHTKQRMTMKKASDRPAMFTFLILLRLASNYVKCP